MINNPYDRYKQQSVMTMTPGEMLLKLYDETIKQLHVAISFIEEGDITKSNVALQKAQRIINYLTTTLDFKYEISNNLAALYAYFIRMIMKANVKKDTSVLKEILPMIADLRDAYSKADVMARAGAR